MEKMLITGGNGFLGSHLAEKSLEEGIAVSVLDDLSTSKEINVPKDVRFIRGSVESTNIDEKFDYIVHLAARPSPEDYILNPVETLFSNSIGTLKMLELSLKYHARFFYTSSSEIYGEAQIIPTPETYFGYVNPNGIRSCYDEGKRYSEALIMAFHRKYNIDTRIQRPFNVYGPRIRPDGQYGRVIPRFLQQAISGVDITIHGSGEQTRSFLYVSDWVDATWKMITNDDISGEIVNIGSGNEITIINLAKLIIGKASSSSKISFLESRTDDPFRRSADISKAKKLLKWKPEVELDDGLAKTLEWIKELNV
ncbi:MAG: NAD-dependent epimerase/dehydratase family protein [Cuniculiplasma sp.]|jgi:UDP-glucuronate decarboxylase